MAARTATIQPRRQRSAAEEVLGAHRLAPALLSAAIGLGFLVGAVMKETQGKANPALVNEILAEKLKG